MRKVGALLILMLMVLSFQNCGGGSGSSSYSMLNQSSQSLDCTKNAQACLNRGSGDPSGLTIRLDAWTNANVSSTAPSLVITGTCGDGGFARTTIYWELVSSTGSVVTTSLLQKQKLSCQQGAFSATVAGFTNSTGVAQFATGTQLQVRFTLNGYTSQGALVSPANSAQAQATKPITITP